MLKFAAGGPNGTIWIPFTGARALPFEAKPGVAVSVNPVPLIPLNTT
jgi:hypothetical protein